VLRKKIRNRLHWLCGQVSSEVAWGPEGWGRHGSQWVISCASKGVYTSPFSCRGGSNYRITQTIPRQKSVTLASFRVHLWIFQIMSFKLEIPIGVRDDALPFHGATSEPYTSGGDSMICWVVFHSDYWYNILSPISIERTCFLLIHFEVQHCHGRHIESSRSSTLSFGCHV
jgi:hypothetical protein